MNKQTFNLNLSPRYCPNWNVWDVARELYANALDADPHGLVINTPDRDTLTIFTNTIPNLSELFVIGAGTKGGDDTQIGQFGEGVKLAALVATRNVGCSLVLELDNSRITFELREYMGLRVLHADVETIPARIGYTCTLHMPGAGNIFSGRILEDKSPQIIPKAKDEPMRVYSKGIFICDMKTDFPPLFNYNLNDLDLNRDRSIVSMWNVVIQASNLWEEPRTYDELRALLTCGETFESMTISNYINENRFLSNNGSMVTQILKERYGDKACIKSTDYVANSKAITRGYTPIIFPEKMHKLLTLPSAESIAGKDYQYTWIDNLSQYQSKLDMLHTLGEYLGFSNYTICVFKDTNAVKEGVAFIEDLRIGINERMFNESNLELIHTYIHECCHIHGEALDCSREFEYALGIVAAKLAVEWVTRREQT